MSKKSSQSDFFELIGLPFGILLAVAIIVVAVIAIPIAIVLFGVEKWMGKK